MIQLDFEIDADTDSGTITWDNESVVVTNITLGIGFKVTVTAPSSLVLVATPMQIDSATGIAADDDVAPDYAGADSFTVTGNSGLASDNDTLLSGFAHYIGGGTFGVAVDSILEILVSTSGGSGLTQPINGRAFGTVTVTCTYEIPEPSTLLLMGFGSLVLESFARYRRK